MASILLWIDLKHWDETKNELVQELKRMNPFGSREPIATLISVTPGTNEIRWHAGLSD